MPGPCVAGRRPARRDSTPADDERDADQHRERLRLTSGSARISPPRTRSTTAARSRSPRSRALANGAHEVDDAGDDEPDPEHEQDREQALARPPHHDEAGHDPEQPEHRGEHPRPVSPSPLNESTRLRTPSSSRLMPVISASASSVMSGIDEGEDAGDRAEHPGDDQHGARAGAGRRGPPAQRAWLWSWRRRYGARGVSEDHTARVISTEPPGASTATRTSGASSAACASNSRAGSPVGWWPMRR